MDIKYLEPKIIEFLKQHEIRCKLDESMFNKLHREILKIHKRHSITDPLADIPKNAQIEISDFIHINRFKTELSAILCLDENEKIIAIPYAVRDDEYLDAIKKWGKEFIYVNNIRGSVEADFYYYFIKEILRNNPEYTFLGSYHTHPLTAPLPSRSDVDAFLENNGIFNIIDSAKVGTIVYYGNFDVFQYTRFAKGHDILFYIFYTSHVWMNDIIDGKTRILSIDSLKNLTHEYLKYSTSDKDECGYYNVIFWKHLDGTIWKYHRDEVKEIK